MAVTPTNSGIADATKAPKTKSKRMKVNGIIKPQLVPYTGNIIYAENITPIARATNQSETIKIVLQFY